MSAEPETTILTLREVCEAHTRETIRRLNGNLSAAARALGIDRRTIYRHLQRIERRAASTPAEAPAPPSEAE